MGRISTIDLLPDDVQADLTGWLKDPAITIEVATERTNALLSALGLDNVTRSAVGRKNKNIKDEIQRIGKEMRDTKAATQSFYDQFGDQLGEGGKFLAETMQAFILKLNLALYQLTDIAVEDVYEHSKAVKNLTGSILQIENALTKYTDREAEIRKQALQEAAEQVETSVKSAGLSKEKAEEIKRDILGIS